MNAIKERKIVYTSGQIAERVRAMAAEIDALSLIHISEPTRQ